MSSFESLFATSLDAARIAAAGIPDELSVIKGLGDTALLSAQRGLSELRRVIDSRASAIAGEVAYRSRHELGYAGLARREGFGSAEKLIQSTIGSTSREATTLVSVGTMVHEALIANTADPTTGALPEGSETREPWLASVGAAVAAGELTIEKARAIKAGLGEPSPSRLGGELLTGDPLGDDLLSGGPVGGGPESGNPDFGNPDDGSPGSVTDAGITAEELAGAAERLLAVAESVNADKLYSLARQYRDELDAVGIARRERMVYEQRAFRRTRRPNGLPRFTFDPDIETAAYFENLYDNLLSPRRSGPRFIDPEDQAWAETIANDERTNDQYLHDAFAGLIRLGVDADTADRAAIAGTCAEGATAEGRALHRARIVGSRVPSVRVLTTQQTLATRRGNGRIEGSELPVSVETVERTICTAGTVPLRFSGDGQVLDLGRETRLFTGHQKVALAARDGGCLWPDCDRPPAWTEAHHINQWARDGGRTDVRDGVLLCRYHHLLLHNNHWEIVRRGAEYELIPPPAIDPQQRPRPLRSKSAALRDLLRERDRENDRANPRARDKVRDLMRDRVRDRAHDRGTSIRQESPPDFELKRAALDASPRVLV